MVNCLPNIKFNHIEEKIIFDGNLISSNERSDALVEEYLYLFINLGCRLVEIYYDVSLLYRSEYLRGRFSNAEFSTILPCNICKINYIKSIRLYMEISDIFVDKLSEFFDGKNREVLSLYDFFIYQTDYILDISRSVESMTFKLISHDDFKHIFLSEKLKIHLGNFFYFEDILMKLKLINSEMLSLRKNIVMD